MASLTHPETSFSKPAGIVLIVAAVLVVAETLYFLVDLYGSDEGGVSETYSDAVQLSIEQIKAYPLFNLSGAKPDLAVVPATKLHMALFGTAWHKDASQSSALIKVQSNKPKVFRVKDSLGRGIRVKAIEPDRVLIERQGALETLPFPNADRNFVRGGPVGGARADGQTDAKQVQTGALGDARSAAMAQAAEVLSGIPLDLAAITASVTPGSGVQLDPTHIAKLADQAPLLMDRLNINASGLYQPKSSGHIGGLIGLQDGDRIVSVNGQPFSDIVSNPVALAAAAATGKIKLSVRRGGENIVITTALP